MLIGRGLRLRALERDDLPMVTAWFNDPETRKTLTSFRPVSLADEQQWFDGFLGSKTDYVHVIDVVDGDAADLKRPARAVGCCGIHRIDWKNRHCVVGIFVGTPQQRGKGYGTEAMRVMVRHAHKELGLVRVELEVFPQNVAGVKSYQSLGFVKEGARRSSYFRDGRFHDLVLMSCLPGELKESSK